jgi:hypothetical protein
MWCSVVNHNKVYAIEDNCAKVRSELGMSTGREGREGMLGCEGHWDVKGIKMQGMLGCEGHWDVRDMRDAKDVEMQGTLSHMLLTDHCFSGFSLIFLIYPSSLVIQ